MTASGVVAVTSAIIHIRSVSQLLNAFRVTLRTPRPRSHRPLRLNHSTWDLDQCYTIDIYPLIFVISSYEHGFSTNFLHHLFLSSCLFDSCRAIVFSFLLGQEIPDRNKQEKDTKGKKFQKEINKRKISRAKKVNNRTFTNHKLCKVFRRVHNDCCTDRNLSK